MSCQDPDNPGQCVVLQSLLIDGSHCGKGHDFPPITWRIKLTTFQATAVVASEERAFLAIFFRRLRFAALLTPFSG